MNTDTVYNLILIVLWATVWSGGFWYFRTRRTRGPLFRRLSRRGRICVILGFVAVPSLYCLSYAPLLQLWLGAHGDRGNTPLMGLKLWQLDDLFVPVQWMIDNTPLRQPLLWWAGFWDVPERLTDASASRLRSGSIWGTTPPWLYASGWLLIGTACSVIPPYILDRALHVFQTRRLRPNSGTQAAT